jgi:hypothetical protein
MTSSISFSSGIATALDGLRRSERATDLAIEAVGSGSLDPDALAEAATVLQGSRAAGSASALALEAGITQQRRFIDILA